MGPSWYMACIVGKEGFEIKVPFLDTTSCCFTHEVLDCWRLVDGQDAPLDHQAAPRPTARSRGHM